MQIAIVLYLELFAIMYDDDDILWLLLLLALLRGSDQRSTINHCRTKES
jgi:hypothetical protein